MSTTPTQSIAVPEPALTQEDIVQRARDMIPVLRERQEECRAHRAPARRDEPRLHRASGYPYLFKPRFGGLRSRTGQAQYQREIAAGQTLNIYTKAQDLNRFRAEIHIPASLDRRIGINWTKHRVEPDHALREILKQGIGPHIASVRKMVNRRRSESTTVDHKSYEALIARKAKLLTLPKAPKIEREREGQESGTVTPKGTDIQREGRSEWPQRVRDRCEFREGHMTAAGPLWEPDMRGQKIIVTFNVDHPLWARFVLEEAMSDESKHAAVLELLHLFSYCLTTAEIGAFSNDSDYERLINMRQQLSNNMRVLLT